MIDTKMICDAVPGQFVRINVLPTEAQDVSSAQQASSQREHLLPIVNSPYAVRRDSADLDASLIEVIRLFTTIACKNTQRHR